MKPIPWLLLTITVLILVIVLQWQCNKPVVINHTTEIDSLHGVISSQRVQHTADSLSLIAAHSENDSLRLQQEAIKMQIENKFRDKIVELTFQRNKFRTAAEGRDTVSALAACAEFIRLADSAYLLAASYKQTIDSLQSNGADRRGIDSAAIAKLYTSLADKDKQIDALNKFLMDAVHANHDLEIALSKTKKGRWLLTALGAVAGGLLVNQFK